MSGGATGAGGSSTIKDDAGPSSHAASKDTGTRSDAAATDAGPPSDGAAKDAGASLDGASMGEVSVGSTCTAAVIKAEEQAEEQRPADAGLSLPPDGGCRVQPAPCVASCELPGCTVVSDMEIRCNAPNLAQYGLHVAPSSTETFVVATGDANTHVFEIRGATDGRELPAPIPQNGLLLSQLVAVGLDGVMHIVGVDDSAGLDKARTLFATRTGDAWQTEPLVTSGGQIVANPRAFEMGPDGVAHVYGQTDASTGVVAQRSVDGKWTLGARQPWSNLTLSPSGGEVLVRDGFVNGGDVEISLGGVVTTVGVVDGSLYRANYGVPQPSTAAVPPVAIAGFRSPGFWLMWPTGGAGQEVAIPVSARIQYTCTTPAASACTGGCREQGVGVEQDDVLGVARTADGAAWVGFLTAERDLDLHYFPLVEQTGPFCHGTGPDLTVGKLHVFRSRLDGAPVVETLNLPVEQAQSGDLRDGRPELDLRGFGRRLAIATRVRDPAGYTKLRVVTLDTGGP